MTQRNADVDDGHADDCDKHDDDRKGANAKNNLKVDVWSTHANTLARTPLQDTVVGLKLWWDT